MMTEREIAAKIEEREHCTASLALKKAKNILSVDKSLMPCVEKWFAGENCEFSYRDIDLEYIRKKLKCNLTDSVLIMNRIIGDDDYFERFKRLEITYK